MQAIPEVQGRKVVGREALRPTASAVQDTSGRESLV